MQHASTKQLFETQKMVVELARRHNKVSDDVVKLVRGGGGTLLMLFMAAEWEGVASAWLKA